MNQYLTPTSELLQPYFTNSRKTTSSEHRKSSHVCTQQPHDFTLMLKETADVVYRPLETVAVSRFMWIYDCSISTYIIEHPGTMFCVSCAVSSRLLKFHSSYRINIMLVEQSGRWKVWMDTTGWRPFTGQRSSLVHWAESAQVFYVYYRSIRIRLLSGGWRRCYPGRIDVFLIH